MECPYCDGKTELIIEKRQRMFRDDSFEIFEHYFKCDSCKKEFTTDEIDTLDILQVYNQYRERHNIPFPAQLTALRNKYGLSAVKMSEILGLGVNQYRLYEGGAIPGDSQATLLNLVKNTRDFLTVLETKKSILKDREYEKIKKHLQSILQKEELPSTYIDVLFDTKTNPSEYTGYTIPDFDKLANMILFFIKEAPYRVRLNKYLFYADFMHFSKSAQSISGCPYAAIPMGPVLDNYDFIFGELVENGLLSLEPEVWGWDNSDIREKFSAEKECDLSLFTDSEIATMSAIVKRFHKISTANIVEQSHKEAGWIEKQKSKGKISYQKYGFLIKS